MEELESTYQTPESTQDENSAKDETAVNENIEAADDVIESDILTEEVKKKRPGRPKKIAAEPDKTEEPPLADPEPEASEVIQTIELIETVEAIEHNVPDEHEEEHDDEHLPVKDNLAELEAKYYAMSREDLVKTMEETVKEQDIIKIKSEVALIKVAFIKANKEEKQKRLDEYLEKGLKKEDFDQQPDIFEERFNIAFSIFKENKNRFNEQQEKIKQENLEAKKRILEEIKILINSEESLKKTHDEFKELQERWKAIGQVPKDEMNTLWQNYNFYVEKFFDKVRMNKELKDLDLKKNLEKKMELCEKVEELLLEKSMTRAFKMLQKYHDEWREIGPVALDKKDDIWERFRGATEKINKIRQEYYDNIKNEQEDNYKAKNILCEKAEQVLGIENKTNKDWQEQTNQMNELLQLWKTLGPAPKYLNEEVWTRFKSSLDTFFENQKEFYNVIKQELQDNYNRKVNLCLEAEAIRDRIDWRYATQDIIRLQDEWKKIGQVPQKYSDKIWKRFRAACDDFFKNKNNYFKNIQQIEEDNLNKKKELIEKVKQFVFTGSKNESLEVLKGFQREWMEIGHVPMKDKDALHNEFREAVNKRFDDLKVSTVEQNTLEYKSKIENLKTGSDSRNIIYKEREFLSGKLNKLKEDINLWENNIGFFSRSKSADVLRQEFELKISKAKDEAKVLEAKLKILRDNR